MSEPMDDGALTPEEELRDLLETLAEAFDLDATVVIEEDDEILRGSVEGPGAEALVGEDGVVLEAVQHLAQRIVLRGASGSRVVVDAAGYRGQREQALRAEADRVAGLVLSEGREIALRPMPAAERRFLHEYLRDRGDVETHSEGDEPRRRLVVSPSQ
ncbi:MAG TPA: R3H domain-containing nucleic acid-binding protein [Solirubrobacteraceae bacterium]|jgi:spoIIIJ-associated protein